MAEKRVSKPTVEAVREKERRLKAQRSSACGKVTGKTNEIKALMADPKNIEKVQDVLNEWDIAFFDLKLAHDQYMNCIEEGGDENEEKSAKEWANQRFESFENFKVTVEQWKQENSDEYEDQIEPKDSVSQVSNKSKKSSSVISRVSSVSGSIARAKLEAAMKKAELKSRAESLQQRQALEEESLLLRKKKEQLEINAEIAVEDAKLSAIEEIEKDLYVDEHSLGQVADKEIPSKRLEPTVKDVYVRADPHKTTTSKEDDPVIIFPAGSQMTRLNPRAEEFQMKPRESRTASRQYTGDREGEVISNRYNVAESNSDEEDKREFFNMMKQQNEIASQQSNMTRLLMEHQMKAMLPQRVIQTYAGDPVEYRSFTRAFEYGIEEKTTCSKDRLYYLEQYTAGEANAVVRSCIHMNPEVGYREAKKLLEKRFGNKYKISESYIQKAQSWPVIKAEEKEALSNYAVFLRECHNTMKDLNYQQEMNHSSQIQILVSKLPYKLRDMWRTITDNIQEEKGLMVVFEDLVKFVEKQSRILSNPVYGNVQVQGDQKYPERKSNGKKQDAKKRSQNQRANFSTNVDSARLSDSKQEASKGPCLYCSNQSHSLATCQVLQEKEIDYRVKYVKDEGLCFGCLKKANHIAKDCRKKITCEICQRRHPTILHRSDWKVKEKEQESSKDITNSEDLKSKEEIVKKECGFTGSLEEDCAQTIVPVTVRSPGGPSIQTYAFLDNGSNAVFCSKELMKQLQIKGKRTKLQIKMLAAESATETYALSGLSIMDLNGKNELPIPTVYVQDTIPVEKEEIPTQKDVDQWGYLKGVQIRNIDASVGLLIGRNIPKAMEPLQVINSQGDGPYACRTRFGWAVYGLAKKMNGLNTGVKVNRIIAESIESNITKLFNHDFIESQYKNSLQPSVEDKMFLRKMEESVRVVDGHFELCLPLRGDVRMPNNKPQAELRLAHLKRKLSKQPKLFEEYRDFIENMIEQGYAETVPKDDLERNDGRVWYIPHHGVRHPKKLKLRVVYDCAAEYKGRCLNKELLQGPDLTSSMVGVLLRFRQDRVAVMADIKAMFSQVRVSRDDRDLLRFYWWPGGNMDEPAVEYRMASHVFGATSSPSCANYALQRIARNQTLSNDVQETLMTGFYVDDCLKSLPTAEGMIRLVSDLSKACQNSGFHLTKWISNDRSVQNTIAKDEWATEMDKINLDKDPLPTDKALGMLWCTETDNIKYKIDIKDCPNTRRGVLSTISGIYDPLGLLAAALLPGKFVFQDLCRQKLEWDQEMPKEHLTTWKKWLDEVPKLEEFTIERCIKPHHFDDLQSVQLHHFADASENGYGTVSYIRMEDQKNEVHCSLLFGKARVAPLKQMTIPRLELTAATVAVKMHVMLTKELSIPVDETFFWTDSMTVLRYVRNETTRFQTFVANRVTTIRELSEVSQWRYVPSEENPADDCSRGMPVETFLKNKRWTHGPEFLWRPMSEWPMEDSSFQQNDTDGLEVKKSAVTTLRSEIVRDPIDDLMSRYSTWYKLKKAVAWILKIKDLLLKRVQVKRDDMRQNLKCAKNHRRHKEVLSVADLERAETAVVRHAQGKYFEEDILALKKKGAVGRSSPLCQLDPMLQNEVLRVGGRLRKAKIPVEVRHPVILPKNSHVSRLILEDIHEKTGHSGRNYMLSNLNNRYWLIGANSAARKVINKCVVCRKQRAGPVEQKMADLLPSRVTVEEPPFSRVGVDYFGPIEVKLGRSRVKRYGVLFTCLAVRAIHLEKADSLDTDSCIDAIRRFIARRGPVKEFRSDNGTNFVGAEREMRQEIQKWNKEKFHESMLQRGINWIFNPPSGSHCGGVWERQIKTVRKLMYLIANQQTLTDEGLQTLFCEVESIVNNRPITKAAGDVKDLDALTPNHLLQLKVTDHMPPILPEEANSYSRRRWKQIQHLTDVFWKRWTGEYLPQLQSRQKWQSVKRNVKVGDVVLIVDNCMPRNQWGLGRVVEAIPDQEGLVRRVKVKTKSNILYRPVAKLCMLLECDEE